MGITAKCKICDCELTLDCGDYTADDTFLDLTLTCENACGAPVLNAFVLLSDFQVVI